MRYCIAHRGWSGRAPENTMASIAMAIEEPRIQAIEIDVQLTKDGVPVVIHDFTLERTTNGKGRVKDYTYEQLASMDAGEWFSHEFAGEKIPRLEDVLLAVRGKTRLLIELKTARKLYPQLGEKVAQLICRYEMQSEVRVISFNHQGIKALKEAVPSIKTGLIFYGLPTLLQEQLKETGAEMVSMAYQYLSPIF
ncbi:MAG: glycerophosphodiester phosphodiesterase, partial [Thermincolia bacterium]